MSGLFSKPKDPPPPPRPPKPPATDEAAKRALDEMNKMKKMAQGQASTILGSSDRNDQFRMKTLLGQ